MSPLNGSSPVPVERHNAQPEEAPLAELLPDLWVEVVTVLLVAIAVSFYWRALH